MHLQRAQTVLPVKDMGLKGAERSTAGERAVATSNSARGSGSKGRGLKRKSRARNMQKIQKHGKYYFIDRV